MWSKIQIRQARKIKLAPLLNQRGFRLGPLPNDNYRILPDPDDPNVPAGLIVKQSFWRWPERDIAGNPIDFLVLVEGKSFHQAMQILSPHIGRDKCPETPQITDFDMKTGKPDERQDRAVAVGDPSHHTDEDGNYPREQRGNPSEIIR